MEQKEISVTDVVLFLRRERKKLLIIILSFFILGVFVSLDASVVYTSYSKILPEGGESGISPSSSLLSKLGSLGGFSMGSLSEGSGIINPLLYTDIVKSNSFIWSLGKRKYFIDGREMTLKTFLKEEVRKPLFISLVSTVKSLPSNLFKVFKSVEEPLKNEDDPLIQVYGKEGEEFIETLKESIDIKIEENMAVIIAVELPNPKLAAEVNKACILYIQDFVTDFRRKRSEDKLAYLQNQLVQVKEQFEKAQQNYTQFKDRNISLSSSRIQSEMELLKNDYDLSFEIYSSIIQQIEQTKIAIQDNTPIIKVIEPAKIPAEKSAPARTMIVLAFLIAGLFFSVIFVYVERMVREIKNG